MCRVGQFVHGFEILYDLVYENVLPQGRMPSTALRARILLPPLQALESRGRSWSCRDRVEVAGNVLVRRLRPPKGVRWLVQYPLCPAVSRPGVDRNQRQDATPVARRRRPKALRNLQAMASCRTVPRRDSQPGWLKESLRPVRAESDSRASLWDNTRSVRASRSGPERHLRDLRWGQRERPGARRRPRPSVLFGFAGVRRMHAGSTLLKLQYGPGPAQGRSSHASCGIGLPGTSRRRLGISS
jgi:hypothetical protein